MLTAHMDGVHSVMWLCRVGAASCTTCLAYYLVLYSAVAALELHNRCWLVDALRSDPCAAGVCAPAGMLLLAIAWVRLERLRIYVAFMRCRWAVRNVHQDLTPCGALCGRRAHRGRRLQERPDQD